MRPALLLSLTLFALPACDRQAPDLRDWRPSDHDHTQNPGQDQVQAGADGGMTAELAAHGLNEVAIVAWDQSCVRCHGRFGRGDGPQGAMVHAADLTNPRWLATVTDDDILKVIREGRGLMPAFPLPESTLRSLVKLVRLLGDASAPAASASAAGAPGGSAAPSSSAAHRAKTPAPASSR